MKIFKPNFYIEFANAKLDLSTMAEFFCDDPDLIASTLAAVESNSYMDYAVHVQYRLKKALEALIHGYDNEHLTYFLKLMEKVTWHTPLGWSEAGQQMPQTVRRKLSTHTRPAKPQWYFEQGGVAMAAAHSLKQAMQSGRIEKLKICVGACCGRFHERKSEWCSDSHKKRFKTRAKFASWIDLDEMYIEEEWEARLRCPVLKSLHEMLYY